MEIGQAPRLVYAKKSFPETLGKTPRSTPEPQTILFFIEVILHKQLSHQLFLFSRHCFML